MKIGIITLHRATNDGSIMQAYCMERLIKSLFPESRVEIIDYRSRKMEKVEFRNTVQRKFPFIRSRRWNKRRYLLNFLYSECSISPKCCVTDDIPKAVRFIEKQGYDVVIVGSDTVWQIPNIAINQEVPHIFYLPHLKNVKKVAFAPSADALDISVLNQDNVRAKLHSCVSDFDFISYRDEMAKTLLSKLNIPLEKCHYIADPTILWDFSSTLKPINIKVNGKPLLAGISAAQSDIRREAAKWFLEHGYQVVNFSGELVDGQIPPSTDFYRSISHRLSHFQHLDILVSDRFHSSIFTLKLAGSPVIFVEPIDEYQHSISKGRDLFRRLGMEEMVWQYSPESGGKIPIDKYLDIWKDLQVHPQEGLSNLKQSCEGTLKYLKSELTKL